MPAPGKPDLSQYSYSAISSLVLTADRSAIPRRDKEPDGAPESLAGRIDPREMGSRAKRDAPKDVDKKKKRAAEENTEKAPKRRAAAATAGFGYADILEATQDVEGIRYQPRTAETRTVYELILGMVHRALGDQAQDVVRSAADTILESLKTEGLKDFDKKKEVEEVLGSMPNEEFTQLLNLSKKITDYVAEDEEMKDPDDEKKDALDDAAGVAVVWDEGEEEADDDYEIRDESDASEDEDAAATEQAAADGDVGEESLVLGGEASKREGNGSADSDRVSPHDIDGFWLQRLLATVYSDPTTATEKTTEALSILSSESSIRDAENALMELLDFSHHDIVRTLVKNRDVVVWCTKLARSDDNERMNVEVAMRERNVGWILKELRGDRTKRRVLGADADSMEVDVQGAVPKTGTVAPGSTLPPRRVLDLDSMAFAQGGHLMSNKKTTLPPGTVKRTKKGYEEIHVPYKPIPALKVDDRVPISSLPEWTQAAFPRAITHLNRVQSKLYPVAYGTDEPILLCAPTGAGKTNVAVLTILNELSKVRDEKTGSFDLDAFKVVYIAPMKALVQEMVNDFTKRLGIFGVQVGELTGDSQMTKQQIADTQIIVTTPEKWDVITRKSTDTSYTNLVRLIIIDEIHLLHDERGPVLEAIVARSIRRMEQTREYVRLVALSATLPNYQDVARFLRVDSKKGLFFFDVTYRSRPLQQQFVGITEKKAIKRYQVMNEVCYEKVLDQAGRNQSLVFVHSRKETAKTAKFIRDMAVDKETIAQFVKPDSGTREILLAEAPSITDPSLKELLPFGFAIHHAGLNAKDREIVEELFKEGHLQVLVSTATLAWGVNLPAHCVIIKGTQIYNPEKGRWVELSSQDVLQMLGRAGRPQYDEYGEGIIITNHSELQYYLSLMNQQLPIESQLVAKLADNLNAEIVLGTIRNRDEAVQWLGYTYLYVRMLRDPGLYSVGVDYLEDDPHLEQKRADIAHSAAVLLERCNLIKYDRASGRFQSTELGRIASHYYVTHNSMATYNQHLKPTMSIIELFRVFALSNEFRLIPVRQDEKLELSKLLEKVPIPVKESVDEPAAKINVLLQAFISNLTLEGFALVADMVYVQQSAGRILRAVFEICLKRGWAIPARAALDMCKMAERRMWSSMSPLRQFKGVPGEVIRKAEAKQFPWYRYFDLSPPELGELLGLQNAGRLVHRLVHQFPKLDLQAHVQPITRSVLRIDLTITPDFQWDDRVHGASQAFWIIVEDVDGEIILFHDSFLLRKQYATGKTEDNEHNVTLTVPMYEPVPPNYYVSVVSDRWLHSETRLPISFKNLILPEKFPQPTPLLDLQPTPFSALHNAEYERIYSSSIPAFNKIQSQVFPALYTTDENVFVGAPTGSGKTICAELALLRLWSKRDQKHPRAVCILPYQEMVDLRVKEWTEKFGNLQGGKQIVSLSGDSSTDLRQLEIGHVIVCTPTQWDMISRRWRKRKHVQTLGLLICDEAHLVGGEVGPTYEVVISRTRYVSAQIAEEVKSKTGTKPQTVPRIIALSVSLANARDFGEWMGAGTVFNFPPSARPLDLDIHLQSFSIPHFPSLMIAMSKPAYISIKEYSPTKPVIIFAPSRRQCRLTANDILTHCLADDNQDQFLNYDPEKLKEHLDHISDQELVETLTHGIGFYHEALDKQDKKIVERLFEAGVIQVLIASRETAWSLPVSSYMVIILGVQYFEGQEHRYADYPVADVLQMMGHACRPTVDDRSRCVLMCQQTRKDFYRKFLNEGLPIESHLPTHLLHDFFLAEIAEETIENKQDAIDILTWTFFYRRLTQNPNYYNLNNINHEHLSNHLSELVEVTLQDLVTAHCISIEDEMNVGKLNLGWIAAYYNISYITIDVFSMSINERTKLKGLLEIISSSTEFEAIPIRRHEDVVLRRIYDRVPVKTENNRYESPAFKSFLLLQAYFSRLQLPPDLVTDQTLVLSKVVNLLHACVDVMASNAFLNAMGAMDLAQMCVQAAWESDSPLKQIPHFEPDLIKRCKAKGIESVYDLMEMEDDQRTKLLDMTPGQLRDVATFVNSYPSLEVAHEFDQDAEHTSSEPVSLKVTLSSGDEDDEDEEEATAEVVAVAPFYPLKKIPNWWLVVGDPQTRQLIGIRRVTIPKKSLTVDLKLTLAAGVHKLHLYVICDSYMGADHDIALDSITVAQGADSDEDSDDDEDEEMDDA